MAYIKPISNPLHKKPFYTETELSKMTGIPRKTLQRFRKEGAGPPFVKFGPRTIRYPKNQFEDWLNENISGFE